ncbi:hypothetical protein SEA_BUMBLE_5 [Arthrobacter phage Bumble]|uniref:Uncharacterized protein n=1 Tax=Arthrobacter phage Bumble TaxID=2743904 RepID=A0A7G3VA92_9CAUD|nr:hypothetical protein SEA_BUMBLE_5 [Arthrobacter phage Bumble]
MMNFHDARALAIANGGPLWAAEGLRGTYYVSPDGYETADVWILVDGAEEYLLGGDEDYVPMDKPVTVVFKRSGELVRISSLEARPLLRDAADVHDPDPTPPA